MVSIYGRCAAVVEMRLSAAASIPHDQAMRYTSSATATAATP
jgi:hypothetical protein